MILLPWPLFRFRVPSTSYSVPFLGSERAHFSGRIDASHDLFRKVGFIVELPEAAIKEFMELYQRRSGRVLGVEEAMERAYRFLGLYRAVLRPNNGNGTPTEKIISDKK